MKNIYSSLETLSVTEHVITSSRFRVQALRTLLHDLCENANDSKFSPECSWYCEALVYEILPRKNDQYATRPGGH